MLEQRADRKLQDANGQVPAYYALQSGNPELVALFKDRSPQVVLHIPELLMGILFHLPINTLFKSRLVSPFWNSCVISTIDNKWLYPCALTPEAQRNFHNLPTFLQRAILMYLSSNKNELAQGKVGRLLEALLLTEAERAAEFFPGKPYTPRRGSSFPHLSDIGLTLFILEPIPRQQLLGRETILCTPGAVMMLCEGLLTSNQLTLFRHSGNSRGPHDNLRSLVCEYGYQALHEGLLRLEEAPYISELGALLTPNGLKALRLSWLTPKQAKGIYHSGSSAGPQENMKHLLSDKGLTLLEKKVITPEQAAYITGWDALFNESSLKTIEMWNISFADYPGAKIREAESFIRNLPYLGKLLASGYLTLPQAWIIGEIKPLASAEGLMAFEEDLIDAKALIRIFCPNHKASASISNLALLLTPNGITALRHGWLTLQDASEITNDLKLLLSENGLKGLREKLISIEEVKCCKNLTILKLPNGLDALRKKLITLKQAAQFYHSGSVSGNQDNLADLLTPTGLVALKEGLITPEQACRMPELRKFFAGEYNHDLILALRLRLVTIEDLSYEGQYSLWKRYRGDFKKDLREKLSKYNPRKECTSEELEHASTTIQKHMRSYLARREYCLFKQINIVMKTSSVNDLPMLQQVKEHAEHYRFNDATVELEKIQKKNLHR